MNLKRHRLIAALMAAAILTAPGTVLAGDGAGAADQPVIIAEPVDTDDKEPVKEAPAPLVEVKITREEAIAIAAKFFAIPEEMGEPYVSLSQSKAYATWDLNWRTPSKKPNPRMISVMVNALTGQITGYHYSGAAAGEVPLSYSRSQAYKVAAEWLAKLAPDRQASLRYVDNPLDYGFYGGNAVFQFHWDRMEQGYPVSGDGADLTVDARTGELQNFNLSWRNDLAVTLPKEVLDQAQAEDAYRKNLPMQLMYRYYQKPATDKGEWKLVYRPFGHSFPMVNQEGQLIGYDGKAIEFSRWTDLKLVPASDKPYAQPEKPLTRDEALARARALTGRTDAPSNMDCRESGEEQKRQACSFHWNDEAAGAYVNLEMDLATGLVTYYGNWDRGEQVPPEKFQAKVSAEQARTIAIEFMQKFRPDLAGKALVIPSPEYELKMAAVGEPVRNYYFQFMVTREYIPIYGHEAGANVDAATGSIRHFSGPMVTENEQEPFPALTNLIKGEAVIESFLKNQGLEQTWVTFNPMMIYPGKGVREEAEAKPETLLVWAPRRAMNIDMFDAVTGVPYDYSGRDMIEAAKRPVDIEGHAAQREIELLWARGIFELKDGKFNPDATASAAELARWLVLARGMQPYPMYDFAMNFKLAGRGAAGENLAASTEAPYFGAALQAGILLPEDFTDDADPNAPVSRELYSLWVSRALGYGDIAKMENRIEMPFTDKDAIGAKYANAVALLYGLKIDRGDAESKFNPGRQVTRGEAAKMLFAVAAKDRWY
ncbi:MAG TPA: S-layer homology domain-containing protein [Symbiobacteriaceae bacterium]|nr:S-layer homology domain-containing protein [Symbiobacteriaceae bacterium]